MTELKNNLLIGMNGRFFPNNWRSALDEISFAKTAGFSAIQFPGKEGGLTEDYLGSSFSNIAAALSNAGVTAVMEMLIFINEHGKTVSGSSPLDVLKANLGAITALPCRYAHWHLAPINILDAAQNSALECQLVPEFKEATALAGKHGFKFGFEHNEARIGLFASPEACVSLLDEVPDLALVWDINHGNADQQAAFEALIPRMSMLHVSDTPLPEVNYHWPLGLGNFDFPKLCKALQTKGFSGPAILEIGGLPKSGGYGQDTNEALINSLHYLKEAYELN